MQRQAVTVLVAIALTTAACGGDETSEPVEDATTTSAALLVHDDDHDHEAEGIGATASWVGVTADTIKVGVLSIDFEGLAAAGVETGRTNVDQIFVAALEAINDRGGVHGRRIEAVNVPVLPVGSASHDAACVTLTEDDPVFVVIGSPGANVECYTVLNETAVVAVSGLTDARAAAAQAPFATVTISPDREAEVAIERFVDMGVFEGQVVGLTGVVDVSRERYETMAEVLTSHGIDFVPGLIGENDGDVLANQADGDVIAERFDAEGVTLIVNTVGLATSLVGAADDPDPVRRLLVPFVSAQAMKATGLDLDAFDGFLSVVESPVGTTGQPAMADDPLVAACVADIEARTGEHIPFELDSDTSLNGAINACSMAGILEAALLNAGPHLTHETFQAGLEAIGDIDLPGYPGAHLGPGDMDAARSLTVVEFDSDREAWVPVVG